MELSYHYLLDIALILISTKLLGLLTKKIQLPQVVGALLAGVVLGPALLNILHETNFITQMAELGVIILMFSAGLETDIKELKNTGFASFIIALFGVLVPVIGGFAVAYFFNTPAIAGGNTNIFLQNIFIGIILTATSVSITVETLKELGKISTRAGNAILGAALIDDIIGIIGVTVIIGLSGSEVSIGVVLIKIVLYFVLACIVGFIFYHVFCKWVSKYNKNMRRFVVVAFSFCLLMSFVAERYFGISDITGAFLAGLIISNSERTGYISNRFETLSYMLLSPIFFASIGIKVELVSMTFGIFVFSMVLLIVAVITKIVGCGFGAKLCKYTNKEALQIGTGMVSRGEVALIIASKGKVLGLISSAFFAPIVIVVVVTTIITPILLKFAFKKKATDSKYSDIEYSELVDHYEESKNIELAEQELLRLNKDLKENRIPK